MKHGAGGQDFVLGFLMREAQLHEAESDEEGSVVDSVDPDSNTFLLEAVLQHIQIFLQLRRQRGVPVVIYEVDNDLLHPGLHESYVLGESSSVGRVDHCVDLVRLQGLNVLGSIEAFPTYGEGEPTPLVSDHVEETQVQRYHPFSET